MDSLFIVDDMIIVYKQLLLQCLFDPANTQIKNNISKAQRKITLI